MQPDSSVPSAKAHCLIQVSALWTVGTASTQFVYIHGWNAHPPAQVPCWDPVTAVPLGQHLHALTLNAALWQVIVLSPCRLQSQCQEEACEGSQWRGRGRRRQRGHTHALRVRAAVFAPSAGTLMIIQCCHSSASSGVLLLLQLLLLGMS